jgi:hypothetical protein
MSADEGGAVKYMLFICADPAVPEPAEQGDPDTWVASVEGIRLHGNRLRSASTATCVRTRDGRPVITDGPFAQTAEQICGYDVIDCADLDEAIDIAGRHPVARWGTVEIRPFRTT